MRPNPLSPEFIAARCRYEEAWADYQAANHAAAEQYKVLPISLNIAGPSNSCDGCGQRTEAKGGVCRKCAKERGEL